MIQNAPQKLAASVVRNPNEDLQSMRNIKNERNEKIKILLDLATEFANRALKTKRNTEHEILLKCSEIIQEYASDMMKEELNEK